MYSIFVDLLSKTICSGVSVYFGGVRVGLSEMQFKFQLGAAHVISNINAAVSFRCCCTIFVL